VTLMHVRAMAVWTPRYPSLDAWLARQPIAPRSSEPSVPAASILGARVRGRASVLTRMIAEVVAVAASDAALELATAPLIVGSAFGEMETTARLLAMMCVGDGALSPARFQSSVHNAASGAISIATGNQGFSSCITAGHATTAALLHEARALIAESGGDVIVVMADERLPSFFAHDDGFESAAAALVLSDRAGAARALLYPTERAEHALDELASAELGKTPVAPLLALIDAVHRRQERVLLPAFGRAVRVPLGYEAGV